MAEEFNSTIVNMIIAYINKNKKILLEYQRESYFINKFINLIKSLLMNEVELACFTILLDKMGLKYSNFDHWTYFCILGIYSKKLCGREEESALLINIFSNKNNEFINYYTYICDEELIQNVDEKSISIKLINERFKQLARPINSFCRKNYINYNGVVDKIVKLSQPYGEESNGNQLYTEILNENNNNKYNDILINRNNFNNEIRSEQVGLSNELTNIKKNNNSLQLVMPNNFNEKNYLMNNLYINKYNNGDLNNFNLYASSLNLDNRGISQFSLKSNNSFISNLFK